MAAKLTPTDGGLWREAVRSKKLAGAYRLWRDAGRVELAGGTCFDCGEYTVDDELTRSVAKPGGRALRCRECDRAACAGWRSTPEGRTKQAAYNASPEGRAAKAAYAASPGGRAAEAARVASGAKAETGRRVRERLRARTDAEVEADRARLRPDGMKACRSCGESLPCGEFYANINLVDGLRESCRPCTLAAALARQHRRVRPWLAELDDFRCVYCGVAPVEHYDHAHPQADQGSNHPANLRGACAFCNGSKSDHDLFDWRPDLLALVANWRCEVVELRTRE